MNEPDKPLYASVDMYDRIEEQFDKPDEVVIMRIEELLVDASPGTYVATHDEIAKGENQRDATIYRFVGTGDDGRPILEEVGEGGMVVGFLCSILSRGAK